MACSLLEMLDCSSTTQRARKPHDTRTRIASDCHRHRLFGSSMLEIHFALRVCGIFEIFSLHKNVYDTITDETKIPRVRSHTSRSLVRKPFINWFVRTSSFRSSTPLCFRSKTPRHSYVFPRLVNTPI